MGIYLVVYNFTATVTIFPDAIEIETMWTKKRLALGEIRGRHEYETTDSDGAITQHIKLLTREPGRAALEFTRNYNFDGTFYAWLDRVPKVER